MGKGEINDMEAQAGKLTINFLAAEIFLGNAAVAQDQIGFKGNNLFDVIDAARIADLFFVGKVSRIVSVVIDGDHLAVQPECADDLTFGWNQGDDCLRRGAGKSDVFAVKIPGFQCRAGWLGVGCGGVAAGSKQHSQGKKQGKDGEKAPLHGSTSIWLQTM